MNTQRILIAVLIALMSMFQLAMARHGVYDEEARQAERMEKQAHKETAKGTASNPAKRFAGGVKEATVDSAKGLISETAEDTATEPPIVGTIEGARKGSGKVLDKTVKGAYKVATLGFGELKNYEVEEPAKESDDTTKIKIKIPGT